jgi:hypothetical protein
VHQAPRIIFQLAEVAVPRELFATRRAPGQPNNLGGGVSNGGALPPTGFTSSPEGPGEEDWGCCSLGAARSKGLRGCEEALTASWHGATITAKGVDRQR